MKIKIGKEIDPPVNIQWCPKCKHGMLKERNGSSSYPGFKPDAHNYFICQACRSKFEAIIDWEGLDVLLQKQTQ